MVVVAAVRLEEVVLPVAAAVAAVVPRTVAALAEAVLATACFSVPATAVVAWIVTSAILSSPSK